MTMPGEVTANSVLAAVESRRPGMKPGKHHLLMFFMQGHHLAHFGRPLFGEPMTATDRGVSVAVDFGTVADGEPTGEGPLNTVGYVLERYGSLAPTDLRTLIVASRPWRAASGGQIDSEILRLWFRRGDETNDPDDERPNRAERAQVEKLWKPYKTLL